MSAAKVRQYRFAFRVMTAIAIALGCVTIYLQFQEVKTLTEIVEVEREVQTDVRQFVYAKVTAYCACSICCEDQSDGRTAWWRGVSRGYANQPGCAVAPDAIPYGTWLHIPGAGWRQADDTGGAMRQSWKKTGQVHIDLRFNSHREAREWGVRTLRVQIHSDNPTS